jgi:hypothetical protein
MNAICFCKEGFDGKYCEIDRRTTTTATTTTKTTTESQSKIILSVISVNVK